MFVCELAVRTYDPEYIIEGDARKAPLAWSFPTSSRRLPMFAFFSSGTFIFRDDLAHLRLFSIFSRVSAVFFFCRFRFFCQFPRLFFGFVLFGILLIREVLARKNKLRLTIRTWYVRMNTSTRRRLYS